MPAVVVQPAVALKPALDAPPTVPPEPLARPAELETFADRLADLAEHLHGERLPYTAPRIISGSPTPAPAARPPLVLDVTPVQPLLAPPPSVRLLAEPQPPSVAAGIPAEQVFHPRPAESPARSQQPMGAEPSSLRPAQFPNRPDRVAAPRFAPFQDYYKAADRLMGPAAYATKTIANGIVSELKVTLPGPALPRELMSLQAAGLVPIRRARRTGAQANRYGWATRLVVLGILLTAGLAATYSVMPGPSTSAPPKPAPDPAPPPPVSARSANSLARFVEVTGIRFMEVNKKPQIQYLVVNHSSAPLGSVMVYVTLRAANAKSGQPPIARLTFRSPALAAFEAKEMFSSIERTIGPLELPDWQDLHADVEVQ
ncbi:MAG: hypothetical protein LAO55_10080 [Acidobacteriia bacterium]|nr:hypothetical protein [Terriglobia bacterium]